MSTEYTNCTKFLVILNLFCISCEKNLDPRRNTSYDKVEKVR